MFEMSKDTSSGGIHFDRHDFVSGHLDASIRIGIRLVIPGCSAHSGYSDRLRLPSSDDAKRNRLCVEGVLSHFTPLTSVLPRDLVTAGELPPFTFPFPGLPRLPPCDSYESKSGGHRQERQE